MQNEENKKALILFIFIAVALVCGVLVFLALKKPAPPPAAAETAAAPEPVPPAEEPPEEPTSSATPLEKEPTDEELRQMLGELSGHPWLAGWLEKLGLGKLVAIVSLIARGESPRKLLGFLPVEGKFQSVRRGEREFLDPHSYGRYDALVEVFVSLDSRACAALIAKLRPFLDRTVREIEKPGMTFRKILARAMGELLKVPRVSGDIPLYTTAVTMKIGIPELESMSQAQKHLLRMGPENIRKVQDKLRELGRALAVRPRARFFQAHSLHPHLPD